MFYDEPIRIGNDISTWKHCQFDWIFWCKINSKHFLWQLRSKMPPLHLNSVYWFNFSLCSCLYVFITSCQNLNKMHAQEMALEYY